MESKSRIRKFLIEEIAALADYSLQESVVVSGVTPVYLNYSQILRFLLMGWQYPYV
ncbi:MAG: hypothetical protein Q4A56_03815 [Porphyromonadaceae bacterium]|nr:hypothetical protein [Porphyromonadaceae bacterium]